MNTRLIFQNLREIAEECGEQKALILIKVRLLEIEFTRLENDNARLGRAFSLIHNAAVK